MERRALVTGSFSRIAEVGMALKDVGLTVREIDDAEPLEPALRRVEAGSLDCYVQLPADLDPGALTGIHPLRRFLTEPLLGRVDAAAMALSLLRPRATVVLVAGRDLSGVEVPGGGQFRMWFLDLLARAIRAEPGGPAQTVVLGAECGPEQIARAAVDPGEHSRRIISECASLQTDLNFADWRREVLSRTGPQPGAV